MQQILYTTTDKIRSALGVDERDMSDSQITDRDPDKELRLDLTSWVPTHSTIYAAGTAADSTETEQILADALTLYSTYFCALISLTALKLAAPQAVSDGKNTLNRFATIDWQKLEMDLRSRMANYQKAILDLTAQTQEVTSVVLFSAVGLATDPVTTAP